MNSQLLSYHPFWKQQLSASMKFKISINPWIFLFDRCIVRLKIARKIRNNSFLQIFLCYLASINSIGIWFIKTDCIIAVIIWICMSILGSISCLLAQCQWKVVYFHIFIETVVEIILSNPCLKIFQNWFCKIKFFGTY